MNIRRLCTTKAATITARPLTPKAVMRPTATPSSTTLRSFSSELLGDGLGNDAKVGEIVVAAVAVGDIGAVGGGLLEGLNLGAAVGSKLERGNENVGRKVPLCEANSAGDGVGTVVGVDIRNVVGCNVGTVVGVEDGKIDAVGYDDGLKLVVGVGVGGKLIVGGPLERSTVLESETVAATLLTHVKQLTFDIQLIRILIMLLTFTSRLNDAGR